MGNAHQPKNESKEKTVRLSYNSEKDVKLSCPSMFHLASWGPSFDYFSFC